MFCEKDCHIYTGASRNIKSTLFNLRLLYNFCVDFTAIKMCKSDVKCYTLVIHFSNEVYNIRSLIIHDMGVPLQTNVYQKYIILYILVYLPLCGPYMARGG